MKRADILLALGAAAVAVILFLLLGGTSGDEAIIYLNGEEYARMSLYIEDTLCIDQGDGKINIVETDGRGGVRMQSSSCKNRICIDHGWLYASGADNAEWIVCLPNGISICIAEGE